MIFRYRCSVILLSLLLLVISCKTTPHQNAHWQTPYEKSDGLETPRYAETMDFFKRLDTVSPMAKMILFGVSPEGRDLNLFIISKHKCFTPEQAQASGKPIVLIQCCIHPGESEGKDAAMMLARDLLIDKKYPEILDNLIVAIIPIFNVDGHERFGPFNRINQNGPKEMGWRVTSTRLNLNRDFVKADAPEMRVWLTMFNQWLPHLFIDCHTTDGQDFQYVLTYNIDTHENFGGAVSRWAKNDFLPAMVPACEAKGHIIGIYGGLDDERHPELGMTIGVWRPMLSNPYLTVRNRAGLLIETHSLKSYPPRVQATYNFILVGLQELAKHPDRLLNAVKEEDARASQLGKIYNPDEKFPLQYRPKKDQGDSMIYRGNRFEEKYGKFFGDNYLAYTSEKRDVLTILFEDAEPTVTIAPPLGYLIPRQWTDVIEVVGLHAAKMYRLTEDVTGEFECYRFSDAKFRSFPYEGRQLVTYKTDAVKEQRTFKAGSVYVPLGCPESKIIMQMLEPQAPDALVGWGFFNTIFEMREYFEPYIMEPMAQQMIAEHPELLKEFNTKLASDSAFAANSYQRLMFFYERSPYWDQEKNLYPVARVIRPLGVKLVDF
ncbi:M14 family metallopeptidase [candidate division KSB1 bacterium]|nr:M14 family metallopeptidase [candidate division KSB1 bacterium]